MKKVLFMLSFCCAFGIATANAQSCNGKAAAAASCCASKAARAASTDATIEKRMADDGTVTYVRKEADAQGAVRFVSVQYDEASNAFVNAAPKTMPAAAQTGMVRKSCAAGAAGAGKACCTTGGTASAGKACCAGKAAATPAPKEQ